MSGQECLDYTLIDQRHLHATRIFDPPLLERLRESTALPSEHFPSDHIPVVVEIAYKDREKCWPVSNGIVIGSTVDHQLCSYNVVLNESKNKITSSIMFNLYHSSTS